MCNQGNQIEKKKNFYDIPLVKVPNLIGLTKDELLDQMVNLKIDASGKGDVIVRQSPEAGQKVKEGSKIRLYFDTKD